MRRRSGKRGTVGASPLISDLVQLETEFWDRPAEQVHADLQSPLNWPIAAVVAADKEGRLSPKQKAKLFRAFTPLRLPDNERHRGRVRRVGEALASRSDEERELARDLPFRVVERWVLAPPDQRDQATDWIMAYAIHAFGPEAFRRPAIHAHLTALWGVMHSARSVAERTAAKKRWLSIMRAAPPNLRAFKEPGNTIDAAAANQKIAEALRRIAPLRKRHTEDLDEVTRRLTVIFSDWRWPSHILKKLAEGIIQRQPDIVRAMIQEGVGRLFGRGHTGIRDALAAESRRAKEQRRGEDTMARIVAGKRRYIEWLTRRGLKPHPALLAQLKNLRTIS